MSVIELDRLLQGKDMLGANGIIVSLPRHRNRDQSVQVILHSFLTLDVQVFSC
jgi:hypothetical protein